MRRGRAWAGIFVRLFASVVLMAATIAVASAAMYVTTAPRLVSVLVEPFSLLLMPGLIVSIMVAGPHDFSPLVVVEAAAGFYFVFFFLALTWRSRVQRRVNRGSR